MAVRAAVAVLVARAINGSLIVTWSNVWLPMLVVRMLYVIRSPAASTLPSLLGATEVTVLLMLRSGFCGRGIEPKSLEYRRVFLVPLR